MKNKKALIIIFSIIGAYLVLAIILFGWDNFINKFQGMYVMMDPSTMWKYKDGKWSNVTNEKEYNWKNFDVYIDNQLLGKYDLLYNNKWYLFDENRVSQKYDGSLIAIKGNKKYSVIDFEEEEFDLNGKNLLKDILDSENIRYPEKFTYAKKVVIDVDGDNIEETIYTVSNAFTSETDLKTKFSLIFIDDGKPTILYKDLKSPNSQYDMCVPKLKGVLDINKDLKYELIFQCNYFSTMGTCNSLYQQENGIYKFVKGC